MIYPDADLSMVTADGDEYQSIIDTTSVNKEDLFTPVIFKLKGNMREEKLRRKLHILHNNNNVWFYWINKARFSLLHHMIGINLLQLRNWPIKLLRSNSPTPTCYLRQNSNVAKTGKQDANYVITEHK